MSAESLSGEEPRISLGDDVTAEVLEDRLAQLSKVVRVLNPANSSSAITWSRLCRCQIHIVRGLTVLEMRSCSKICMYVCRKQGSVGRYEGGNDCLWNAELHFQRVPANIGASGL